MFSVVEHFLKKTRIIAKIYVYVHLPLYGTGAGDGTLFLSDNERDVSVDDAVER